MGGKQKLRVKAEPKLRPQGIGLIYQPVNRLTRDLLKMMGENNRTRVLSKLLDSIMQNIQLADVIMSQIPNSPKFTDKMKKTMRNCQNLGLTREIESGMFEVCYNPNNNNCCLPAAIPQPVCNCCTR